MSTINTDDANFANNANSKSPGQKLLEEKRRRNLLSQQPLPAKEIQIPDSIYEKLPTILKESCGVFNDKFERDVYLTGALSVLGGCFHNVYAYNQVDHKKVSPNLLTFIVAPAASGKGVLKYSLKLAGKIKESFAGKSNKNPKKKSLIIPANISSAGFLEKLEQNKGVGIMLESEIDTLLNVNRNDWGNYSDILRLSFENEEASLYRKCDKIDVIIPNVKLSLAISGTHNQFKDLIPSTENGLFSRGCYYIFENNDQVLKCYGRFNATKDIDEQFKHYAETLNDCYQALIKEDKVYVLFSEVQLSQIQVLLQKEFKQIFTCQALQANVKRTFIIAQKIATILACLEAFEAGKISKEIICSEENLKLALDLMLIYLRHSYKAYELLPKIKASRMNLNEERILAALPEEFTRKEAIELGAQLSLSDKTIDNALKYFKEEKLIELVIYGKYKKTIVKEDDEQIETEG
jgi:hypothetical protein